MKTKAFYNPPRYILRKKLILDLLSKENFNGKTSFEFGYGAGDLLITCAKKGLNVHGYDFSDAARQKAGERVKASGLKNIEIYRSCEEFSDKTFDYIFACEVLEHIEYDKEELLKWNSSLKENGILILSVPARMKKWGVSDEFAGHFRRYEKESLRKLLKSAGYTVESIWSYPFPLNLILDKMQHTATKQLLNHDQDLKTATDKISRSKYSGIKRKSNKLYRILSNEYLFEPFHWLQKLFLHTDLGSGYVVKAVKTSEDR